MDLVLILTVVLIALQVADIATTHYALKTGIGQEANPFLRKLFDRFGHEPVLLVAKGAFIVLLLVTFGQLPVPALIVLTGLYVWVIGNNIEVIRKAKQK